MADQMITHQSTAAAQITSSPSNVARGQQVQSTRALELEVNYASVNAALPPLLDIKNPAKLKEISNMKLMNSNFHEWKNLMLAEFDYYEINQIINSTHDFSTRAKLAYWHETEQLFIQVFTAALPARIYKDVKVKVSLRDKWLAILKHFIHTDLDKITTDFFNIKFKVKKKMTDFIIRFQDVWKNLTHCRHAMNSIFQIEQFLSKMKSVFSNEIRKLHWSRDIQILNWNFVIQIFKNIEHIRSTVITSSDQALTVQLNLRPESIWSLRSQ